MLKFFDTKTSCHILLDPPLTQDDIKTLESQLSKQYKSWHVEFGRIYSVELAVIDILYKELFTNKKNITITTHKSKLNRYLNRLGFKVSFDSLIKQDIVKINEIEVVLVGGSADSSPKIIDLVKQVTLKNLTLVVVQHVEPNKVGLFDEILNTHTNYKVSYAKDGEKIQKQHIYLAMRDKHLLVKDGFFHLSDSEKHNYSKPSVSLSYESFSSFYKEKLLVIQECGFAKDGVDKLEVLKRDGSKLIIQDIDECEAKPMIQHALNVGVHDYSFKLKEIINYINIIDNNTTREAWIEYLLDKIFEIHNYDFRLYHRDMINRRLDIFMLKHEIKSMKDAISVILFNRSAFKAFFLEISINVTELFRNPDSFKQIVKLLYKTNIHKHNIKIWSAGCSSGEEPYSVAILLDALGILNKSLIYATDFNSVIVEEAKNGIYPIESYILAQENFEKIGLDIDLKSYVVENKNFMTIVENIKNKILFFQHNLIEDSSFNEFDIIICKNVIIYFNDNLQKKVFQLFYDSLKFGGHLILGESEYIHSDYVSKFEQSCENCKAFKKVA